SGCELARCCFQRGHFGPLCLISRTNFPRCDPVATVPRKARADPRKSGEREGREMSTVASANQAMSDLPNLKVIRNGEKVKGTFSAAEMESRLTKLRQHMDAEGIGHVLFTSY